MDFSPILYNLLIEMMVRFVIPYFVMLSSFFFFSALRKGQEQFKRRILSVVKLYAVWSVIYFLSGAMVGFIKGGVSPLTVLMKSFLSFFFEGVYYHLWYFPALIYSMTICYFIYAYRRKYTMTLLGVASLLLFLLGVTGSVYYEHFGLYVPIPFIREFYKQYSFHIFRGVFCMVLPYFFMGYLLCLWCEYFNKNSARLEQALLVIFGLLFAVESFVVAFVLKTASRPEMQIMAAPMVFFLMLFLLKHPLSKLSVQGNFARHMSIYIFLVHPLIISAVQMLAGILSISMPSVLLFSIVLTLAVISGIILSKIDIPLIRLLLGVSSPKDLKTKDIRS